MGSGDGRAAAPRESTDAQLSVQTSGSPPPMGRCGEMCGDAGRCRRAAARRPSSRGSCRRCRSGRARRRAPSQTQCRSCRARQRRGRRSCSRSRAPVGRLRDGSVGATPRGGGGAAAAASADMALSPPPAETGTPQGRPSASAAEVCSRPHHSPGPIRGGSLSSSSYGSLPRRLPEPLPARRAAAAAQRGAASTSRAAEASHARAPTSSSPMPEASEPSITSSPVST